MAEFVGDKPKCRYCKDTGMVPLATSSKRCLDCKIGYNKTETTSSAYDVSIEYVVNKLDGQDI